MFLQKSLRAQILALLSGSLVAMLLIALACFYLLSSGVQSYRQLIEGPLHTSQLIDEANLQFKIQVQEWKNVLLRGKQPADRDKYWQQFQARQGDVQNILGELSRQPAIEPALKARIDSLRDAHRALGSAYQQGLEAYRVAGADPAAGDNAVKGVDRATSEQMSELVNELRQRGNQQSTAISNSAERTVLLGIVVMLISGLLIGLFSLWLVNRHLVQPIQRLIEYVAQLSQGRFSARVANDRQDELGRLALGMNVLQYAGKAHALAIDELALAAAEQPAGLQAVGLRDTELDPVVAVALGAHGMLHGVVDHGQVFGVDAGKEHVQGHLGAGGQPEQGLAPLLRCPSPPWRLNTYPEIGSSSLLSPSMLIRVRALLGSSHASPPQLKGKYNPSVA